MVILYIKTFKFVQKQSQMKFKNLLLYIITIILPITCTPSDKYIELTGYAQGGTYSIKINLKGKDGKIIKTAPAQIKKNIDSLFNLIDSTLSGYNKGSMLSRFNKGENVVPNNIFKDIYSLSYKIWEETGGAVDAAAAPLFDLWGFGFTRDSLPNAAQIADVISQCGMKRLKPEIESAIGQDGILVPETMLLNSKGDTHKKSPMLNYNAIAQGYSCDIIAKYLYSIGVKDMLVNIGEIFCDGVNPHGKPWVISIDTPKDGNFSPGEYTSDIIHSTGKACGIVTSGNYRKYYIKDGKKYAHTIDPRTGYPVSHNLLSATIITTDATVADAYATYCMVIGLEASKEFINSRDDIEGVLIYDDNGTMKKWSSSDSLYGDVTSNQ